MSKIPDFARETVKHRWARVIQAWRDTTPNAYEHLGEACDVTERSVRAWASGELPGTYTLLRALALMGPRAIQRFIALLGYSAHVVPEGDAPVLAHLESVEGGLAEVQRLLLRNHLNDATRREICGRLSMIMKGALECHNDALPRGRPDFTREGELPFPPSGGPA